jgi:hypothetical protein
MLELKQLSSDNFQHFLTLLMERGEAPEDYYRWKYLLQPSLGHPTGFIAYIDKKPAGCIGIINRTYHADDGNDYPATWFADWFVNDNVRGKGVGELLMKEVRKISSYNFGVPGPAKAQKVCKHAGYAEIQGFAQYTLYIKPFRCGYNRFAGSPGVKYLRGIKNVLFSAPVKLNLLMAQKFDGFTLGIPNEEQWSTRTNKLTERTYLKRTDDFLQWVTSMPVSVPTNRLWWSINSDELYSCGYLETDYWGLKRAVVIDLQAHQLEESIWNITITLSQAGADWVTFCYFDKSLSLKYWTKTSLPLHAATPTLTDRLHLTDLDKDSSWRSFLFAS